MSISKCIYAYQQNVDQYGLESSYSGREISCQAANLFFWELKIGTYAKDSNL